MPPTSPNTIVWIDEFTAGDPLFARKLARAAAAPDRLAAILVHGAAERAARLLEGALIEFRLRSGVPVSEDAESASLIERAYREVNKEIVAAMTEFGAPAVSIQGTDRRLLLIEENELRVGAGWLPALMNQGIVPVVSALAGGSPAAVAVPVGRVVVALAGALGDNIPEVRLLHGDARSVRETAPEKRLEVLSRAMSEADLWALKRLLEEGVPVLQCRPDTVLEPNSGSETPIFG